MDQDALVHVSSHPAQGDLRRLYDWVQPPAVIPVHGTPRDLTANAAIARACHVPRVYVVKNGDLCRLASEGPVVVASVENGRLTLQEDGRLSTVPPSLLWETRKSTLMWDCRAPINHALRTSQKCLHWRSWWPTRRWNRRVDCTAPAQNRRLRPRWMVPRPNFFRMASSVSPRRSSSASGHAFFTSNRSCCTHESASQPERPRPCSLTGLPSQRSA
jgi:hypothetical protein